MILGQVEALRSLSLELLLGPLAQLGELPVLRCEAGLRFLDGVGLPGESLLVLRVLLF